MKRYLLRFKILLLALITMILVGCNANVEKNIETYDNFKKQDINIVYFDVGQGNSALIEQNNEYAMIDTGENGNSKNIINYFKNNDIKKLKYMIITHGDSDHIGGTISIMETVDIDTLIIPDMNDYTINTKTYINTLEKAKHKNINIVYSTLGKSINLGEAKIKFYGPVVNDYDNSNDWSISSKITYDNSSFMFTGDAGKKPEKDMSKEWKKELKSDVCLAGHHGSNTSNSETFLNMVNPQIVVISCGKNNKYGHPHKEAMDRFSKKAKSIYRTDELGNIFIGYNKTDKKYIVSNIKGENEILKEENNEINNSSTENSNFIGNKNSKVFHNVNCTSLPKENNRIYFQNREDALKQDYKTCGRCQP